MKTRSLIEREITVARIHARRAARAVGVFVVWLLVTWLGPEVGPADGWSLWASAVVVALYGLLTAGAVVAVWWTAVRVVRAGVLRRVVSAHFAPFWMVAASAACAGGAIWRAVDDPMVSVWLAAGTSLAMLAGAYGLARALEVRELRQAREHLAHAPSEVALGTWKQEIAARLDAASSIRLDA